VVRAVCERLIPSLGVHVDMQAPERHAAVLPCLRELLQAAGWLYTCFMPSSRLGPPQQHNAREAWTCCVLLAADALRESPETDMAAFLLVVQERTAPRVPGKCHPVCVGREDVSYTLP
jgi:hypothetical protein